MATIEATVYSSKIIKAGALLADTKLLLEHWDPSADVRANLDRVRRENLLGKASRARVDDVLAVFRQRYLLDRDVLGALTTLARRAVPSETIDRILYFQAARSDRLLHDVVTEVLLPWSQRADREVHVWEVEEWVGRQAAEGRTERAWSPEVRRRVVQGLLSTLRDFGILEGTVKKRIAAVSLPTTAFAFVAFQLNRDRVSGDRLLRDPEWRSYLLSDQAVERYFLEAHQERLLQYHAAGRVVRVDFPAQTLEEYAHVLADR